jgi:hypothetical protein
MTIFCNAAQCDIPEAFCETEQERNLCAGCTAVTRRCLGCNAAGVVTDGARGLCAHCQSTARRSAKCTSGEPDPVQNPDEIVRRLSKPQSVRAHAAPPALKHGPPARDPTENGTCTPVLFDLLLEHAQRESDGSFRVSAPVRTLAARRGISIEEAKTAVSAIAETEGVCIREENGAMLIAAQFSRRVSGVKRRIRANHQDGPGDTGNPLASMPRARRPHLRLVQNDPPSKPDGDPPPQTGCAETDSAAGLRTVDAGADERSETSYADREDAPQHCAKRSARSAPSRTNAAESARRTIGECADLIGRLIATLRS